MPSGATWTRVRYRQFLRGTLAVVEAIEPTLTVVLPDLEPALGPTPSRAARLRHDLRILGDAADVAASPAIPQLQDRAEGLGAAYVLEGSMLGGQYVAQALVRDLGVGDDCLTYLRPPGVSIAPRWKAFVAALDAYGATAPVQRWRAAEAAAAATFTAFTAAFRREGLI
jgi:heme oxygenase